MVDREARDKAAELLQQFKDGLITSAKRFAEAWPGESQDIALQAIWTVAWCGERDAGGPDQSGNPDPRSPRPDSLNADGQALFERCALFLKSDLELDPQAPYPAPPPPSTRGPLRAAASLVLMGGAVVAFVLWGFSSRTAGLLMLWGLLWTLLYHLAEHAVCRPPEGWSIGTVFWPFACQDDYERERSKVKSQK